MHFFKTIGCFMLMSICVQYIYAQTLQPVIAPGNQLLFGNTQIIKTDSGWIINHYYKSGCKNYFIKSEFKGDSIIASPLRVASVVNDQVGPKLITIHGNVSYDFYYRSKIDTPFIQQDMQQHNERVWLDIMVKEKYPFRIGFSARQSNSSFYKDLIGMNLNFDRYAFVKSKKQSLIDMLNTGKWQNPELKIIDSILNEKISQYQNLAKRINGPETLQKIIEERENAYQRNHPVSATLPANQLPGLPIYQKLKLKKSQYIFRKTDSLIKDKNGSVSSQIDSVLMLGNDIDLHVADSVYFGEIQHKKSELDSLQKSIALLKKQSDSLKKVIAQNIIKAKQAIYKASDLKQLDQVAKDYGIKAPQRTGADKFLAGIKSLNIGRCMIDYTPLTAQNIILTGVNIEYNPSYYMALAVGKFDYGFRDVFGRGVKQSNTYLTLGRIGWGDKDKRAIILSVFNGRKNNYAGLLATDSNKNTTLLFGYSIETILKMNKHSSLSAELAKSTKSNNASSQLISDKSNNLFRFSDNSNLGFNVKGQTQIIETGTSLSGFFRKTGEAFQSFSSFTYNTDQQSWQARVDQSLLKNKINLTAMLRQNDFTNPATTKTFKTSMVFKSIQTSIRFPRWPIINAGYFPGTQFYLIDKNNIKENAYYILNGSVLHAYTFKNVLMNSSFIYNRYFNKATDSGFVLYKGINYIFSQSITIKKLQFESGYSLNKQFQLDYYTLDVNGDYSFRQYFRLGGGAKFNQVFGKKSYWGESIKIGVDFKKLGGLQLHYEKSYLPTLQQTLAPVEIGRISWYKIF